jgi:hypothetical protein
MSNICVISQTKRIAELLEQQPILGRDVSFLAMNLQEDIPSNTHMVVVDATVEEAESWIENYQGKATILLLLPKKKEARYSLLSERWREEKDIDVDLLTLPIRLESLLYAMEHHVNKVEYHPTPEISYKEWSLLPRKNLLYIAGKKISLTEKEILILQTLSSHFPMAVSKETLLREVWGYGHGVDTHTLETHIYRLRQKTGEDCPLVVTADIGYTLHHAPDASASNR